MYRPDAGFFLTNPSDAQCATICPPLFAPSSQYCRLSLRSTSLGRCDRRPPVLAAGGEIAVPGQRELFGQLAGTELWLRTQTNRDDFRSLNNIADPFKEALRYLSEGDEDRANDALRRTLLLVRTSPDLTRAHRAAVSGALREEFDEAKKEGLGAVSISDVSLDDIVRRRAVPVNEALERMPSLEHFFR